MSNNKNMNLVAELMKMRNEKLVVVREDLKGATFDNTNVPLTADIMTILRSFFTNADEIVVDMSWCGFFGVSAVYLCDAIWRKTVDTNLLQTAFKVTDTDKVMKMLAA